MAWHVAKFNYSCTFPHRLVIIQCHITIIITALNIFFTEDDYRAAESSHSVPVRVAKDHRIATAVTVAVNPLTVMQAEEWEESIMTQMPDDNPFSPNRAGIII